MAVLAVAYSHFRVDDHSTLNLKEVENEIYNTVHAKILRHVGYPVNVYVDAEQASLKVWITIVGSIAAGLAATSTFISQYPELKKGISEMISDYKKLTGDLNNDVARNQNKREEDVIRKERRKGTPGKIAKIVNCVDTLKYSELHHDDRSYLLDQCSRISSIVLMDLDEQDRSLLLQYLEYNTREIPLFDQNTLMEKLYLEPLKQAERLTTRTGVFEDYTEAARKLLREENPQPVRLRLSYND